MRPPLVPLWKSCDYYSELIKIYRVLDRQECFSIREAYTKEVCARTTWAILDDGRSFFWQTVVAADFAPGARGPRATSYLEAITNSVRNANLIQRATFPWEWLPQAAPLPHYQAPPSGAPPTNWTPPSGAPPTNWETPPGVAPGATHPSSPRNPKKNDLCHQKIKQLMDPYLKRYNNYVNLSDILTASGKCMTGLPTLPQYCSTKGDSFICWKSVLGTCLRGRRCRFARGHVKQGDATDAFADASLDCVSKGVLYYTNLPPGTPASPSSKHKWSGGGTGTP